MDVLIIDDDDQVRKTLGKMLEKGGFMVTGVDNGLGALALLRQHEYRAIICDVQMPFLGGRQFFDELSTERPDLARRVLFVTGNAEDPKVRKFLDGTGRPFLSKPVSGDVLVTLVREVAERES